MSDTKTVVHMIGQAHLDPVWLWRWTEGRAEALATSQSAVDRLEEYPDFQFVRGEAQIYQWIERENPKLFAKILDLIDQGRWHVVNGMIIQPDMNLPQGESFVRHFLLAKNYMRDHLGVEPRVAYCVDSFGHAGTLPQILKKSGFDAYVFMRPGPHEKALPSEVFWWEAPDGSRVLAHRISATYSSRSEDYAQYVDLAVEAKPKALYHTMCFFGVGNHGGGPTKAQIENIQAIARARQDDLEIRFSHPDAYFSAVLPEAGDLPTVDEELYYHAVGCYSANSTLKRDHRQAECALLVAERMAALAELWAGQQAPMDRLRALWHDLCFNQFHDILGGCSIKEGEDEAIKAFGRVILGAREIADDAGRAIAARIDTQGPGGTVVLFNPHAYAWRQCVEYEPWTDRQSWDAGGWGLMDEQNQPVAHQLIEERAAAGTINRLVFQAELPPLGYKVYRFAPDSPRMDIDTRVRITPTSLENEWLALRLDPDSGTIVSCVDKASGLQLTGPGGWNVAQVLEDTSDTWSHGIQRFDQIIGHFGDARITVCDEGPLQASLLIERTYEGSTWQQQLVLRAGERALLLRNWLTWQGKWRMLKLAFDVATGEPQATHDVPFGWCHRPCDGTERATQMWMDVTGPSYADKGRLAGLAVIDDGKYGCDVTGSTMRLTVLRSPPYAFHIPHQPGSKKRYDWIDQGLQEFSVALVPHVGDWRDADIVQRARSLNLPAVPITMYSHPGARPATASLSALSSREMMLTALKPAEDGEGYIVRIADRHGRGGEGELHWLDQTFSVSVAPFEVITLRLSQKDGQWEAHRCDMIERAA
ncbi:MAG: alpha-mannosidase [Anaerolineae bacterium]